MIVGHTNKQFQVDFSKLVDNLVDNVVNDLYFENPIETERTNISGASCLLACIEASPHTDSENYP